MDIIAPINNSLTLLSPLKDIVDNIREAEIKNVIADLSNELADVKLAAADLKEQIVELKQENSTLKRHKTKYNLKLNL